MQLSDRDRRALLILIPAIVVAAIYWFWPSSSSGGAKVVTPVDSVDHAERTLTNLRKAAVLVPAKEVALKQVSGELAEREKGLVREKTAAQAQAQLLQILRRVGHSQQPPLEIKQVEFGPARPFGDVYGEVTASVTIDCKIDELVNLMAELTAQPEAVSTSEVRFGTANPKLKVMPVRLTVSALVPHDLVPKKGATSF